MPVKTDEASVAKNADRELEVVGVDEQVDVTRVTIRRQFIVEPRTGQALQQTGLDSGLS